MNKKIYILVLCAIAAGLVELIIGGILPEIAADLNITISTAGSLISLFAIIYAIASPVLLTLTRNIERKKVLMISLIIFILANFFTYLSHTFYLVLLFRIILAMSSALMIVLCLTIAPKLVDQKVQAKAIGLIFMGISSSLVVGVPVGILISNAFGWRTIFLLIAILSALILIVIAKSFHNMGVTETLPLLDQLKEIIKPKIATAHLTSVFMLAGHYAMYSYFTPFLERELHVSPFLLSALYFLFGLSAVCGGAFGGGLSDKLGSPKAIIIVIVSFILVLAVLPFSAVSYYFFIPVLIVWGVLSWALAPALQSYLINTTPETADIQQSLNTSSIQIGIALGTVVGSSVLAVTNDNLAMNSWAGAVLIVLSLLCASISLKSKLVNN